MSVGLDPWFMLGGLGVPALGIVGVALASAMIHGMGLTTWTGLFKKERFVILSSAVI